ncbi:MAG TPA: hypothetical protein VF729_10675 [Solirubrobacterales bacterium]
MALEAKLAGANERARNASAAPVRVDREAVKAAPPAVPGGDQRADKRLAGFGDEQRAGVVPEQSMDAVLVVGRRREAHVAALPQLAPRSQAIASAAFS